MIKKSKHVRDKQKFIFLSSRSVYGASKDLITFSEDSKPVGNFSNYGYNKIIIENNIKIFRLLRLFNFKNKQYIRS